MGAISDFKSRFEYEDELSVSELDEVLLYGVIGRFDNGDTRFDNICSIYIYVNNMYACALLFQ